MSTDAPAPARTTVQRRVEHRLDNPFLTSPEQRAAAVHPGNFFLSACPGAGKTHTVGLRLAYRAAFCPEMSVAAVSHTNTAIEEIHGAARQLATLPKHYFVGTLH